MVVDYCIVQIGFGLVDFPWTFPWTFQRTPPRRGKVLWKLPIADANANANLNNHFSPRPKPPLLYLHTSFSLSKKFIRAPTYLEKLWSTVGTLHRLVRRLVTYYLSSNEPELPHTQYFFSY